MSLRCFLPAWIVAWATAIFLPSALIAYLGISRSAAAIGTGLNRLPASTWKVADDVGPAVKLMIGGLLLLGFFGLGSVRVMKQRVRVILGILIGLIAVVTTLGLIPSTLSRGFAAALTGTRFELTTTAIYLLGGALAGLAFVLSSARCQRGTLTRTIG